MPSIDRRADARRRAWGRGPCPLRFEPLEGRQLLAASVVGPAPDLVATKLSTVGTADWGDLFHATGTIANQGTATTTSPAEVDIYASTSPILGAPGSGTFLLGKAVIPAGLQPGASASFDQIVGLPSVLQAGQSATSKGLFVTLWVDPTLSVPDANPANNAGQGIGVDTTAVMMVPHQPASLVGTAINLTPTSLAVPNVLSWGDSFNITEQIQNKGEGDAPPTRARIVLTPLGVNPGGYADVTVGDINVPSIPAFQSTNVVQSVTLPKVEPTTLGGATQFTISIVQDADFLTQPIYPQVAAQGGGLDQGTIGILAGPAAASPLPLPDLAAATVVTSGNSLNWGQSFQVAAAVQNVGMGNSGKFTVRFVATGVTGDVTHGIFLGDATVDGLAANASTTVLTTVRLPSKLPHGMTLASPAYARIYAIVDPEDTVDQTTRANNMAASQPVLLSVAGANGPTAVPTYPASIFSTNAAAAAAAKSGQTSTSPKAVLGAPTPASSKKKVVKKKDPLAAASETVTSTVEKQIKSVPDGTIKLLQRLGIISTPKKKVAAKPKATK